MYFNNYYFIVITKRVEIDSIINKFRRKEITKEKAESSLYDIVISSYKYPDVIKQDIIRHIKYRRNEIYED